MKELTLKLLTNAPIATNIYEMRLKADQQLEPIRTGQFVNIALGDGARLLRRPFCIVDCDSTSIRIIYAVVGAGTRQMSSWAFGRLVNATLPLGNGFALAPNHRRVALLSGGLGILPLVNILAEYPDREYHIYAGFGSEDGVIMEHFNTRGATVHICTDDGSVGHHGFPTDLLQRDLATLQPDVILTCGPTPLLRSAQALAQSSGVPTFVSYERRMACGVGACLVCTCAIAEADGTHNRRVCTDGPVWNIMEVVL